MKNAQFPKLFINHKTGYTAGTYGNSGEQFLLVMIDGDRTQSIAYDGQYGHEQRVVETLKNAGYKEVYTPSFYGRMKRKDCSHKLVLSENQAVEAVNKFLNEEK